MIKNYLKIAWRNITRDKVNSVINIAGLAIGMACVILILFYVQDELKYDRFFKHSDHIYQVNLTGNENGNDFLTGNTAPAVGPAMQNEFPEIESYIRIYRPGEKLVAYKQDKQTENYFTEKGILAVDSNFLQVFTYKTKEGEAATCLEKPSSLVITERTAKKYFGNSSALGKILLLDNDRKPFTVTAVLKNIPSQSSFQFDLLVPISTYPVVKQRSWNWWWLQVSTYVKLRDNATTNKANIAKLEAKFPAMVKQHAFERRGITFEEFIKKGGKLEYHLQPFTSVHLYSAGMGTDARLTTLGDIKYVRIFSVIALFIIILACVNFMNLSTAQSAKRAKEVGIRKVLGSAKNQLVKQFLSEAMLYSFISTLIALVLVMLLLKPFNGIAGKTLSFNLLFTGNIWLFVLGLLLLTGLLAGSYPAFYLTSFKPVSVLKGMKLFKTSLGSLFIRNGLVVFQFTISAGLIISTIIVFKQLQFTQNKNLGLDKENVVVIANGNRLGNSDEAFRQELTRLPGVINATISSSIPTRGNFGDSYVPEPTGADEHLMKEIALSSFLVDNDFIPTLQIQVLEGRNFSKDFSDSASVILNETAVNQIGWKNPVGRWLAYPGNDQRFKVIGVAKDFNIESLHVPISPFALFHSSSKTYDLGNSYISVRVKPGNISDNLNKLESKWKKFAPNTPFDFSFFDSEVDALYRSEQRMGTVFGIFTILSICVACLGLFGLAAYTAERRTKEIGVRKVLGASVQGLVALLSKDFIRLVLVAIVIASPVAWWAMNKWLQDFAYRINIEWWMFAIAGSLALLIALLTVSFQAIKAAVANPVKSLRTE
jgi:putative ABC transport system permease protein